MSSQPPPNSLESREISRQKFKVDSSEARFSKVSVKGKQNEERSKRSVGLDIEQLCFNVEGLYLLQDKTVSGCSNVLRCPLATSLAKSAGLFETGLRTSQIRFSHRAACIKC